ncbi:MAG TPA: G1 family glutamic endopeptidase [Chloroflexota bacterium]|jgi:ketosteroid isomerase-like protein
MRLILLVGAVGLLLVACSAAGPRGQAGSGVQSGPASPTPAATAVAGSDEAAVQAVIRRANAEQEQAIAARDPSAMKDTALDAYYQDAARTNQELLDGGIAAIKLLDLEWGPITVTGDTATATTYETWASDYVDGKTDQSRDRNVYTLVRQDGVWKIQADEHPDDESASTAARASAPRPSGGPVTTPEAPPAAAPPVGRGRGQSSNWSGYAARGGRFTAVTGTWTVPQPPTDGTQGSSATWVGIGGESTRDLIQAGTDTTVRGAGRAEYGAWLEMLPREPLTVPLPVHPGDSVTVSLSQQTDGTWLIAFKNNTTGATHDRTVEYASSLSSAEWIVEAESAGRRRILPLDDFGTITFSAASAVEDGRSVNLAQAAARPITMINGDEQPLAAPSALADDGAGFSVTRTANSPTGPGRGSRSVRPRRG